MAFERFTKDARAIVVAASTHEASHSGLGLGVVEAEHLLLALASHQDLKAFLDHDELVTALVREEEQSLAAVGLVAPGLDAVTVRAPRSPKLATSAKLALHRAFMIAGRRGDRRVTPRHLLLGVLAAEHGRVPRALQLAGVSVYELQSRL